MPKLQPAYSGPFLVKRKITELNYLLQLDASGLERLVHHNKLKPYEGDHPPSLIKRARRKLMRSLTRLKAKVPRKIVYFILFLILIVYDW